MQQSTQQFAKGTEQACMQACKACRVYISKQKQWVLLV